MIREFDPETGLNMTACATTHSGGLPIISDIRKRPAFGGLSNESIKRFSVSTETNRHYPAPVSALKIPVPRGR